MRYWCVGRLGIIAMAGLLVGGCAAEGTMGSPGGGASAGNGAASSSTKNIDRVASGAVEDSLNSCMARIPKDATAGQKMLAEESCRRDQANRK